MVFGLVLDDTRNFDAAEAGNGANRRLDRDPGQLVLDYERIAVASRRDQTSCPGRSRGAERVEVAYVRLVLEHKLLGDRFEVEPLVVIPERLLPPAAEAVELDEAVFDLAAAAEWQGVHERAADAERLSLHVLERPVELLVPHEHVA